MKRKNDTLCLTYPLSRYFIFLLIKMVFFSRFSCEYIHGDNVNYILLLVVDQSADVYV